MTAARGCGGEVFQRADAVLTRRVGSSMLLLVRGNAELVEVSGAGVALWDSLAQPRSGADCVRLLARSYGVDEDTVRHDIDPVLGDLVERGALRRQDVTR